MKRQSERLHLRVSVEFLEQVARIAKQKQITMSAFIREAAIEKAEAIEKKKQPTLAA